MIREISYIYQVQKKNFTQLNQIRIAFITS